LAALDADPRESSHTKVQEIDALTWLRRVKATARRWSLQGRPNTTKPKSSDIKIGRLVLALADGGNIW
jgi:hypothetical protein